jgi:hypothetical protein
MRKRGCPDNGYQLGWYRRFYLSRNIRDRFFYLFLEGKERKIHQCIPADDGVAEIKPEISI